MTRTIALLLSTALLLAACGGGHDHGNDAVAHDHAAHADSASAEPATWTCPMHPQVTRDAPGDCPICGMALVIAERHFRDGDATVELSAALQQRLGVRTAEAARGTLSRRVETVGYVDWNARQARHLHVRAAGWIEELHVHSVGERITAGATLYTLYSPELVAAQEEYLRALAGGNERLVQGSRERLRALGLDATDLARLTETRRALRAIAYRAPENAVVTALGVRAGMYVSPDLEVLALAPLDSVWVTADVFPRQAGWIEYGQSMSFQSADLPGETFRGTVDFIAPEIDPVTRALRVRMTLTETDGRLRPGMFGNVALQGGLKRDIVIIPTEALIRTGDGERVILALGDGRFQQRMVHAGMETASLVEILHGLEPGERVVVSGQFLLDSEAQLRSGLHRLDDHGDH